MPRNDQTSDQLNILIPKGKGEIVKDLADTDGLSTADYIRSLIEKDAEQKKVKLDLRVAQHGGRRERRPSPEPAG